MSFNRIKFNYASNIYDFIADSVNDLDYLPKDCAMGSSCYIISSSDKYFKNNTGGWVLQSKSSNEISPGVAF